MNKSEFIKEIAHQSGFRKDDVNTVVNLVFNTIIKGLAEDEEVNITGFGKFYAPIQSERKVKSVKTGEFVTVPPKKVPKFKASVLMKEAIL